MLCRHSRRAPVCVSVILLVEFTLTKFALWASEVIFDSEVSPNGEMIGKLNFTCAQHKLHCIATSLLRQQKLHRQRKRENKADICRVLSFLIVGCHSWALYCAANPSFINGAIASKTRRTRLSRRDVYRGKRARENASSTQYCAANPSFI